MLQIKIKNCFNDLIFDEKQHKYYFKEKELISVTKFISRFKPETDFDLIAFRKAIKEGKTVEEIKKEWENEKIKSVDKGNSLHNFAETNLKNPKTIEQRILKNFLESYTINKTIVGKEIKITDFKRIAGTLDILFKEGDYYEIGDYKTNKNLFKQYGFFKKPFDKFPNTPMSSYILQLNIYKYIIEKVCNIKVKNLSVFWITTNNVIKYKLPIIKNIESLIYES